MVASRQVFRRPDDISGRREEAAFTVCVDRRNSGIKTNDLVWELEFWAISHAKFLPLHMAAPDLPGMILTTVDGA